MQQGSYDLRKLIGLATFAASLMMVAVQTLSGRPLATDFQSRAKTTSTAGDTAVLLVRAVATTRSSGEDSRSFRDPFSSSRPSSGPGDAGRGLDGVMVRPAAADSAAVGEAPAPLTAQ